MTTCNFSWLARAVNFCNIFLSNYNSHLFDIWQQALSRHAIPFKVISDLSLIHFLLFQFTLFKRERGYTFMRICSQFPLVALVTWNTVHDKFTAFVYWLYMSLLLGKIVRWTCYNRIKTLSVIGIHVSRGFLVLGVGRKWTSEEKRKNTY